MNKIIVVDVDGTVVNPYHLWWSWMEHITKESKSFPSLDEPIEYNLSEYFSEEFSQIGRDPMDFWRGDNLYDFLSPIEGSVEVLWSLFEKGFKIHFASHCKGGHMKSKVNFLKRHFPMNAFYATQEKEGLVCDIIIEDRVDIINRFSDDKLKIILESPFTQEEPPLNDLPYVVSNWRDIGHVIHNNFS